MAVKEDVILFGMWAALFPRRVEVALKLKGIEYQYVGEDFSNKSPLLLKYNPVHKKVPVLVHAGKPIAESLIIIEYIDETWKHNPILPEGPHERAMARFWAKFVEDKCLSLSGISSVLSKQGEEQVSAVKELVENFKILEGFLEGKKFFAGDNFGFVDIVTAWIPVMIPHIEEIIGMDLVHEQTLPLLKAWSARVLEVPVVKETLPPSDKLHVHLQLFRQRLIASSST